MVNWFSSTRRTRRVRILGATGGASSSCSAGSRRRTPAWSRSPHARGGDANAVRGRHRWCGRATVISRPSFPRRERRLLDRLTGRARCRASRRVSVRVRRGCTQERLLLPRSRSLPRVQCIGLHRHHGCLALFDDDKKDQDKDDDESSNSNERLAVVSVVPIDRERCTRAALGPPGYCPRPVHYIDWRRKSNKRFQ